MEYIYRSSTVPSDCAEATNAATPAGNVAITAVVVVVVVVVSAVAIAVEEGVVATLNNTAVHYSASALLKANHVRQVEV